MAEHTTLSQVMTGVTVSISEFDITDQIEDRMAELGIFPGARIHVLSNANSRSPMIVAHQNAQLILAKKLTEHITVYRE